MTESEIPNKATGQQTANKLDRRELLSKYGAYTAPLVVAMLTPGQAYADMSGTPYSTVTSCTDSHPLNMMGLPKVGHCMSQHPIG